MSEELRTKEERFRFVPSLDEREVQAEFACDAELRAILIYTTTMELTVTGARQLRDWLNKVLP